LRDLAPADAGRSVGSSRARAGRRSGFDHQLHPESAEAPNDGDDVKTKRS
jgi:hypothetical protein